MSKRPRKTDRSQLSFLSEIDSSLVSIPDAPASSPASHDLAHKTRLWLNEAITMSGLGRDDIADLMTVLSGREVTKSMIDSWTGAARPNRFPADLMTAFCVAVNNNHLMANMAQAMGARLADTVEAQLARLGQWSLVILHAEKHQRLLAASLPDLPMFARARA